MADAVHYKTDPHHTFVTFEVKHFATSTVRARFDDVSGTVALNWTGRSGQADIRIAMASVSSGIDVFDEELRSEQFFDVSQHPEARFVGDDFRWQGDQLATVAGQLTLRGQTHPVTLTCVAFNRYDSPILNAPVAGGDFETTIMRSQWGVDWGLKLGVPDVVKLVIQIEAAKVADSGVSTQIS